MKGYKADQPADVWLAFSTHQRRDLVSDCFGHGRVQAAVGPRRLYFGTGRWRGELLADRMTASGRQEPLAGPRRLTAWLPIPVSRA